MSKLWDLFKRFLSAVGPRRAIGVLGSVYVTLAIWRVFVQLTQGVSVLNALVATVLIGAPGFTLLYGIYWLSGGEINSRFYPDIASWCFAGFGTMASILLIYHLQPGEAISDPLLGPPILTALGSVAGFLVGIYDGQAKTRTGQLRRHNQKLEQTREELESTVHQLERANKRLEHYRQYTDNVLNAIDDIFYVLAEDGTLQRWNESLEGITGYSDAEISSMNAVEFFGESDRELMAGAVAEGFETGSAQVEAELLTKGGESIPYEFSASVLKNPAGETVLAGIGRDITRRKDRERELEQRARQQQAVADLGQIALGSGDADELIREAVRRVSEILDNDYSKMLDLDEENEELLLREGVGWKEGRVGEATVSAVDEDSQAAYTLANNHPIVVENLETETRFNGPDLLRDHDVKSGISTIIGSIDEPWGILGTHDTRTRSFTEEDVNFVQSVANILAAAIERRQYHRELERVIDDLEESNQRLEQFAYAASHDLQEPLRMVSSYLQLIDRRYGDRLDEEGREFLEFAVDGADRMRSMIEGLLHYSRVETKGEPFERVDLESVFEEIREDLQFMMEFNDATITTDALPTVEGDPNQLRQVFQNILKNAIQYSGDEPPTIHVSARLNGTDWTVSVEDEGIGIASEDQERVFDIFQRAHDRDHGNGTGIGLALSQRIVERHDGDIWLDSEPGRGTTVSVALSAVDDRGE